MASKKERLDVLLFAHQEKEQKLILWQDLFLLMDRE